MLDDLLILYSEGKSAVAVVDGPKACFHTGVDGVDNHVVGGDMAHGTAVGRGGSKDMQVFSEICREKKSPYRL